MTPSPQPAATEDQSSADAAVPAAPGAQEISLLKRSLQEQRRALTLAQAEAERERQLREALEAQLLEANAEIVASWDRRKEMARVIGEQQAQLAAAGAGRKQADQNVSRLEKQIARRDEEIASLKAILASRDEALANVKAIVARRDEALAKSKNILASRDEALANVKAVVAGRDEALAKRDEAIAKRDKALAGRDQVIANREEKIKELKAELRARYEELAALQRRIVNSTFSGKARQLARQAGLTKASDS